MVSRARRTGAAVWLMVALGWTQLAAAGPRMLVLGLDGLDPDLLATYRAEGVMPEVDRLLAGGWHLHELGTTMPPQSPVAWSTVITGLDPGGHGIFDFIHRDPAGPSPYLSGGELRPPTEYWTVGQYRLPRGEPTLVRHRAGTAFWTLLDQAGIDATVFKVPANFPPAASEARTLSGMGTPDLQNTFGLFTYVTDDPLVAREVSGGQVIPVHLDGDGRAEVVIAGPINRHHRDEPRTGLPVAIRVDAARARVHLSVGDDELILAAGEWSDWVTAEFELIPLVKRITGICRFHVMEVAPRLRLYVTPMQVDPRRPAVPISTPAGYARELADGVGLFYTQGLPEDTKALDEGVMTDADYVSQSALVLAERRAQLRHELDRFQRLDAGFLFFYFNSPDQTCHMFWRGFDPRSPTHAGCDPAHRHRVRDLYAALDGVIAEAVAACDDDTVIMIMSDHGFAPFHRNVHLNAWLLQQGYLALKPGVRPGDVEFLAGVDWPRTRAYALGINGLYLNLRGREARGVVRPGAEAARLLAELAEKLEAVRDPDVGAPAIKRVYLATETYTGPRVADAPDLVIGYHRGWRGSNASALGGVGPVVFDDNTSKWSGDHCMAHDEVPGVLLVNRPLTRDHPDLRDLAPTILARFGVAPLPEMAGRDLLGARGTGRSD